MILDCFTKQRKHPKGKIVPDHSHQTYEIVYYLYGKGKCFYFSENGEKTTRDYTANTVFICAPKTPHGEIYDADTASVVVRFHFEESDKLSLKIDSCFFTDKDLEIFSFLKKITTELENLRFRYETIVDYTLYELLVTVSRRMNANEKNIHNIAYAISYIDNHFTNKISIRHLAEKSFYSVEHFRKLFKARTGLTPKEYITMKRLERALKILSSSDLPLFQISDECGFENYNHFVNFCKSLTGKTPSQLRQITEDPLQPVRKLFPNYSPTD